MKGFGGKTRAGLTSRKLGHEGPQLSPAWKGGVSPGDVFVKTPHCTMVDKCLSQEPCLLCWASPCTNLPRTLLSSLSLHPGTFGDPGASHSFPVGLRRSPGAQRLAQSLHAPSPRPPSDCVDTERGLPAVLVPRNETLLNPKEKPQKRKACNAAAAAPGVQPAPHCGVFVLKARKKSAVVGLFPSPPQNPPLTEESAICLGTMGLGLLGPLSSVPWLAAGALAEQTPALKPHLEVGCRSKQHPLSTWTPLFHHRALVPWGSEVAALASAEEPPREQNRPHCGAPKAGSGGRGHCRGHV